MPAMMNYSRDSRYFIRSNKLGTYGQLACRTFINMVFGSSCIRPNETYIYRARKPCASWSICCLCTIITRHFSGISIHESQVVPHTIQMDANPVIEIMTPDALPSTFPGLFPVVKNKSPLMRSCHRVR